jgi:hypothetical protein
MPGAARHSHETRLTTAMRIRAVQVFVVSLLATASAAGAYTQNAQLERDLAHSDAKALALFPAKGYKDGAAGFFRAHGLYIVPDSQRAWCTDNHHGVLKPGCYVEFSIQGKGLMARDAQGASCGNPGRWYRAPGSNQYIPTPGPFISNAIAKGEWERVEIAIYGEPAANRLPTRSCGRVEDRNARQRGSRTHVEQ